MKYMILSNGTDFIIKIKHYLFWNYVKTSYITAFGGYNTVFKTEEEAETYIKKEYGDSAKRVRKYKIV